MYLLKLLLMFKHLRIDIVLLSVQTAQISNYK